MIIAQIKNTANGVVETISIKGNSMQRYMDTIVQIAELKRVKLGEILLFDCDGNCDFFGVGYNKYHVAEIVKYEVRIIKHISILKNANLNNFDNIFQGKITSFSIKEATKLRTP